MAPGANATSVHKNPAPLMNVSRIFSKKYHYGGDMMTYKKAMEAQNIGVRAETFNKAIVTLIVRGISRFGETRKHYPSTILDH